jgi:peptide/nickel transport system substrate-binding protein
MDKKLNFLKYYIFFVFFTFFIANAQIKVKLPEAFGDQLVTGFVGKEPQIFNPYQINSIPEKLIARLIFGSGLIQSSDRFEQTNNLVDLIRYEFSSGRKQELVRIFRLKRNIYFHNGIPLRNSDVKFTFDNLNKWGGNILNRKFNLSNIEAVETEGDLEFKFILKRKDDLLEEKLSDIPILSKNYYKNISEIGFEIFNRLRPVGYGPFVFERVDQSVVSLMSFNNYVFDQPFLNRITIQFYDDEKQMMDSFIQGKVDFIEVQTLITARRLHQILQNEIMIFTTLRPEKKIYYILFNVNKPPFNEKKVRFAIKGAIDKTDLVKGLVPQNAHEAYSVIDATNSNFYKPIINDYYKPEASLRILRNDGWQINQLKGTIEKDE